MPDFGTGSDFLKNVKLIAFPCLILGFCGLGCLMNENSDIPIHVQLIYFHFQFEFCFFSNEI